MDTTVSALVLVALAITISGATSFYLLETQQNLLSLEKTPISLGLVQAYSQRMEITVIKQNSANEIILRRIWLNGSEPLDYVLFNPRMMLYHETALIVIHGNVTLGSYDLTVGLDSGNVTFPISLGAYVYE